MPVDKAFEEHIKTFKIISAKFTDGTFEKLPMQANNIMYDMKKDDFTAGFTAGQKSLSPEVRLGIEKLLDAIKRRNAGFPLDYETEIMIIEYCENLLAKE